MLIASAIPISYLKNNMQNDSTNNNKLITPKELASVFWVSSASIYRLIDSRKITFYKIGWVLRFKQTDIDQYLGWVKVEPIKL